MSEGVWRGGGGGGGGLRSGLVHPIFLFTPLSLEDGSRNTEYFLFPVTFVCVYIVCVCVLGGGRGEGEGDTDYMIMV